MRRMSEGFASPMWTARSHGRVAWAVLHPLVILIALIAIAGAVWGL